VSHISEGDDAVLARARESNLLGTCAVAVADRVRAAVGNDSGAAALIALHTFLDGCTIDGLARVLGLSHSGAVRLADRLCADGHAGRRDAQDGRAVSLVLTDAGHDAAVRLQTRREAAIEGVMAPLAREERAALTLLMEKLLAGLAIDHAAAGRLCRMCDVEACGHPETCPVTQAVPH
jgi:MarR family transcriptional repressor of emrRAB